MSETSKTPNTLPDGIHGTGGPPVEPAEPPSWPSSWICNTNSSIPPVAVDEIGLAAFTREMGERLAQKRAEGYAGWHNDTVCSKADLRTRLERALAKGSLVDVANFAMMLHHRERA